MVRTSLVLGIVALALLSFIVFVDRGKVSQGEREQRQGRLLDTLVRDRLSRIEVQRKGVTTVLARTEDKETQMLGFWQVEAPYKAAADKDTVESLIGALEWFNARRTLSKVSAEDVSRFGLDKPRYRLSFTVGRDRTSIAIGNPNADGSGAYARIGGSNDVVIVGKDDVEALDHDPADYHTKELHDGASIYALQRITMNDASGVRVVERRDDFFWLVKPETVIASEPVLTDVMTAIDKLRATRFVSDDRTLAAYGFSTPAFEAQIALNTYDLDDTTKRISKTLRLRIGKVCAGHDTESYLTVNDGPVMCAANADLDKFRKSADALRDTRLLALDESQIHGVRIRIGKAELVLTEKNGSYRYQKLQDGKPQTEGAADEAAMKDWFSRLHAMSAERLAPAAAAPLREAGIGNVTLSARFERNKDKPASEIRFGRHDAGRVAVSRAEAEPMILWFPESALELVSTSTARFRKARLLNESEAAFTALEITRSEASSERVTKKGSVYELKAPAKVEVERSSVDEIVRLFSALEATRFVSDAALPEHGLDKPEAVLSVEYGAKKHTLTLGAQADSGRYARLDTDPAVFVVAEVLVAQLKGSLASLSSLATPLEQLAKLHIEHAGQVVDVARTDAGFRVLGVADGAAQRADTLARALATLRASRALHYGEAIASEGFDKPFARITVTSSEPNAHPYELVVGGPVAGSTNAEVYVRRSDIEAVFAISRDALGHLLEQSPTPPQP